MPDGRVLAKSAAEVPVDPYVEMRFRKRAISALQVAVFIGAAILISLLILASPW